VTLATLDVELRGNTAVARLAGEVDVSNARGLAAQLKESVPNTALALVLDLSETTYLDSSGVHLIFDVAGALRRRQPVLQLVVPPETFVADITHAVGLSGTARTSATLDEALEAARESGF
jgi:anti-anti-sigma factor